MAETVGRPSVPIRSAYAEPPASVNNNCKCMPGESQGRAYAHSGPSERHFCQPYPPDLGIGPSDRPPEYRVRHGHSTGGYYHPNNGLCMCNDPDSWLNGYAKDRPYGWYTRRLPPLVGRPWPQLEAWVSPYRRGQGKHYSWYHREMPGSVGTPCRREGGTSSHQMPHGGAGTSCQMPDGGVGTSCRMPDGGVRTSCQMPEGDVETLYQVPGGVGRSCLMPIEKACRLSQMPAGMVTVCPICQGLRVPGASYKIPGEGGLVSV